ncbi:MAG TPA: integrase core domain-containing protein [Gemmatimonadaceae bacterium]|nr:integrase core domain-containing protein [Gemmatimonadaceae bacterium]
MTTQQKLIKTKVGLLELGRQLGSVTRACRVMGYSRDSFYRFQQLYSQGGEAALEDITHTRTKTKHPQTNGICERVQKTILQEFYQRAFRTKVYTTVEALQADLDQYLEHYNGERPHQRRWCYGKTPMETFLSSVQLAQEKYLARAS